MGRIRQALDGWHLRKVQDRWTKAADDAGEAAAERVSAFYAEQNSRARRGQLSAHRLRADRWCVGLSGADQ